LQNGNRDQAAAHLQQALAIYERLGVPGARRVQQTVKDEGLPSNDQDYRAAALATEAE
jgi:hypothetical protein